MNEVKLFLESIKIEFTKKQYTFCLKKYFDFLDKGKGKCMLPKDRKEIEDKLIEFMVSLKKKECSTTEFVIILCPVKLFYAINDVTLNVKKLCKFMPKYNRVRKNKGYTRDEISRLLEILSDPYFKK
jgi:hypothetical protein